MSPLPENWSFIPLGKAATLQRGFDLPVQAREPGQIPIFAANGPVGTHTEAKVTGPGVVTGRSGTLGRVHYVDTDFWPLNTALWVKDFHGNDPHWISRLLTWMDLKQFTRGAGVPTLNRNLVHVVEVPLPPLAEQKRIAAILDAADALRAKRRETLAQLDTLLQSTFLEMFGDPVTNPMGWEISALEHLIQDGRPITYGILKPGPDIENGVPYIRVVDIKNEQVLTSQLKRTTPEIANQYKRSQLNSGDLLMSIRGHVGRMAIVPQNANGANITQDTARFSLDGVEPTFAMQCIMTKEMQHYMAKRTKGMAVQGINLGDVKKLPIPVPPLDLQRRFATIVESVEQQKSRLRVHLAELDTLFASLQSRAFNGEL